MNRGRTDERSRGPDEGDAKRQRTVKSPVEYHESRLGSAANLHSSVDAGEDAMSVDRDVSPVTTLLQRNWN